MSPLSGFVFCIGVLAGISAAEVVAVLKSGSRVTETVITNDSASVNIEATTGSTITSEAIINATAKAMAGGR